MHKDKSNLHPIANFQQRQLFFFLLKELNCNFSKKQCFLEIATILYQRKVTGQVHEWVTLLWSFYLRDFRTVSFPGRKLRNAAARVTQKHYGDSLMFNQLRCSGETTKASNRTHTSQADAIWHHNLNSSHSSLHWIAGTSLSASLLTSHKVSPLLAEVWPTREYYW